MSRVESASKNIKYGYLGTVVSLLLKFLVRTIFIYTIGITYLGINGLFINVLSVLSLAEIGIGTAMNFSLYKPIAENDKEKIKSIMQLFKRAYIRIALLVGVVGILLVPFLKHIINDPGTIKSTELYIYYLIFLFNTVSSYLVTYKYCLANADQKHYIEINFRTITAVITSGVQIMILLYFKSYLLYLVGTALIELIQKVFANSYLNRRYPILLEDAATELTPEEREPIKNNIKALVFHKVGDIATLQTDNIIVSAFINLSMVGVISNYTLIVSSVTSVISIMFNSVISGFGNLIVTESKERQYKLFKIYRFAAFWFYGFASIAFITLISPFISLWLGTDMTIESTVLYVMIADYYAKGHRSIVNNFKVAAGIFDEDKYLALLRGGVNLIISVILVKYLGLIGIYIGTLVSGLILTLIRPVIIYRQVFGLSAKEYFSDSIVYLSILLIPLITVEILKSIIFTEASIVNFVILTSVVTVVTNAFFVLFLRNREEFIYLEGMFKERLKRRKLINLRG